MTISPPLYPEETEGKEQYTAVECHCSHCERQGAISAHPKVKNIEFTQGLEHKGEYLMGPKKNPHWYCTKCHCFLATDLSWIMENVFKDENRMTINLRMLKDCDLSKIQRKQLYFMKDAPPKYEIS
ncbi:uncharacterized protein LTR77_007998 [Saxophila tyrrhenica]|uniref:CENP-V/GFA domain-containing protein n=1 Tax=Saxophila tyrrhenica TaxID=1690608 RepID=A0AAV9P1I2_9PEZI|nr:hypothetical protein LTR77_007998 [Saxophila tyrrhenica]